MHHSKVMSFAIFMSGTSSGPATVGVDDVGWAFNGTEAIAQTVTVGVDDTSIRQKWFQPFVQRCTGRVRVAFGIDLVFVEGEGRAGFQDPVRGSQ